MVESTDLFLFLTINFAFILLVRRNSSIVKVRKSRGDYSSDDIPDLSLEQLRFYVKWTESDFNNISDIKKNIISLWKAVKSNFHTYRCIQSMSYLNPRAQEFSVYQNLLQHYRSKQSIKVADIGCCFGQDTRQLILDGIPPSSIYSIDIHDGYWKAGLDLFEDTLKPNGPISQVNTCFHDMTLPLYDINSIESNQTDIFFESFDFIILMAVLHTISIQQQNLLLNRIHKMLKSHQGIIMGSCVGANDPGKWYLTPDGKNERYLHSRSSLYDLMLQIGFTDIDITEREPQMNNCSIDIDHQVERKRIYLKFTAKA